MNVNIEVQALCVKKNELRGIPFYAINLLKSLVKRNQNEYSVSFFDYGKERSPVLVNANRQRSDNIEIKRIWVFSTK